MGDNVIYMFTTPILGTLTNFFYSNSCDYPDCKMRFLTQSKLKRHKLTHQKSRYACPQESCEEKFDAYTDLQHHMVDDHPKGNDGERKTEWKRKWSHCLELLLLYFLVRSFAVFGV